MGSSREIRNNVYVGSSREIRNNVYVGYLTNDERRREETYIHTHTHTYIRTYIHTHISYERQWAEISQGVYNTPGQQQTLQQVVKGKTESNPLFPCIRKPRNESNNPEGGKDHAQLLQKLSQTRIDLELKFWDLEIT